MGFAIKYEIPSTGAINTFPDGMPVPHIGETVILPKIGIFQITNVVYDLTKNEVVVSLKESEIFS